MKTALLAALATTVIYLLGLPDFIIYLLVGFTIVYSLLCSTTLYVIRTSFMEVNSQVIESICTRMSEDDSLTTYLSELLVLEILLITTTLFFREDVYLIFFSIGTLLLAKNLISYITCTYIQDIEKAIRIIKEEDL